MEIALELLKEDAVKEVENEVSLVEEEKSNNRIMELMINKKADSMLYHAFCEDNAKNNEHSRIRFLRLDNFPDGIFIVRRGGFVECHICELKTTPTNKLPQLKKQLFSGYLHCKTLMAIWGIDPVKVKYFYKVLFIEGNEKQMDFNEMRGRGKKFKPGNRLPGTSSDYGSYLQGHFHYTAGNYRHTMPLEKIKMTEELQSTADIPEGFKKYIHSMEL